MASNTSPEITGPMVVLHRPQIPQNTGNISRLCVAVESPLVITGKAGFDFSAAAVRRAGLDHWEHLVFQHYSRFKDFYRLHSAHRLIAVTKAGRFSVLDFDFSAGDILLFGNETMGLPPALLKRVSATVQIPMWGPVRSLNLSNSVAITVYEYLRRVNGSALKGQEYQRTYYRGPHG